MIEPAELTASRQQRRCRVRSRVAQNPRPRSGTFCRARVRAEPARSPWSRPGSGPIYDDLASDPSHPVEGGSANDYDYVGEDPVNAFDLDGLCKKKKGIGWIRNQLCHAGNVATKNRVSKAVGRTAQTAYSGSHTVSLCVVACAGVTVNISERKASGYFGAVGSRGPAYTFSPGRITRGPYTSGGGCYFACTGVSTQGGLDKAVPVIGFTPTGPGMWLGEFTNWPSFTL